MGHRPTSVALALVCSAALIAGCGSSTGTASVRSGAGGVNNSAQPPAAELSAAVSALGRASTLTTSVRLGATGTGLGPLLGLLDNQSGRAGRSPLAGGTLSVEVVAPAGKTIGDLGSAGAKSDADADLTLGSAETTYLEVRHVDQTLYLRANVKQLLTAAGQPGAYASLESKAASLPQFVQAYLDGKWISLPDATLSLLGSLAAGGLGASASPTPVPSASAPDPFGRLSTLLDHGVTVRRLSAGRVDRLLVTVPRQSLITAMRSGAGVLGRLGILGRLGGGADRGGLHIGEAPRQFPAGAAGGPIRLVADVEQGALSQLSIDLGGTARSSGVHPQLDIAIARTGPQISAPSGAVAADAVGLLGLFSLFSGSATGGGGAGLLGGLGGLSNGA
jgi:hypothetical protein